MMKANSRERAASLPNLTCLISVKPTYRLRAQRKYTGEQPTGYVRKLIKPTWMRQVRNCCKDHSYHQGCSKDADRI